eukprot:gene14074-biopygen17073
MNFCGNSTVARNSFAVGTQAAASGWKPKEPLQKVESPQSSFFGDEELYRSAATLRSIHPPIPHVKQARATTH